MNGRRLRFLERASAVISACVPRMCPSLNTFIAPEDVMMAALKCHWSYYSIREEDRVEGGKSCSFSKRRKKKVLVIRVESSLSSAEGISLDALEVGARPGEFPNPL